MAAAASRDAASSDSSEDDVGTDDEDVAGGWMETGDEAVPPVRCLFCPHEAHSARALVAEHWPAQHSLHLHDTSPSARHRWRLQDQYAYIRMVNYFRRLWAQGQPPGKFGDPEEVTNRYLSIATAAEHDPGTTLPWEEGDGGQCDLELMRPVIPDDPLLCYDFESCCMSDGGNQALTGKNADQCEIDELRQTVSVLQQQLERMRSHVFDNVREEEGGDCLEEVVRQPKDESYFDSYSQLGIHEEMLDDAVRMRQYLTGISQCPQIVAGTATVLDIGCGTAILSMFAATSGAAHVIAVDQSDVIYHAMDIVRENGLSDKITCVKGRIEDITEERLLKQNKLDKIDVLVSEWMGYFLLYESMYESVIWARDRYRPHTVIPNLHRLYLCAVDDRALWQHKVGKWSTAQLPADVDGPHSPASGDGPRSPSGDGPRSPSRDGPRSPSGDGPRSPSRDGPRSPSGDGPRSPSGDGPRSPSESGNPGHWYRMSCMGAWSVTLPYVTQVSPRHVATDCALVKSVDLNHASSVEVLPFDTHFTLTTTRSTHLTAVAGYFDSLFTRCDTSGPQHEPSEEDVICTLSTSPDQPATHWKQTLFFLPKPLPVAQGETLRCHITCEPQRENKRSLYIRIKINGKLYSYNME